VLVRLIAAKPYADRLFQYRELGRLPDAAARAALIGPAATLGVEYEEQSARQVVRESAGYPYFIQEYGLELWNHAEQSPISLADVETVREIVTDSLERSFFGPRFQLASDAEQRYLAAMAALGDPPYRSSEVASRYGAKDTRGVSVFRESLIQKGLIWSPRRGQVDFTRPPLRRVPAREPPARLVRRRVSRWRDRPLPRGSPATLSKRSLRDP
jgi:hypothetical protein